MMKMEIKMNEEKINREKKYRLQGMYKRLDDGFADLGMLKVEDGSDTLMYYGINEAKDFANFGRMVLALKREEWFMDNVVVWRLSMLNFARRSAENAAIKNGVNGKMEATGAM